MMFTYSRERGELWPNETMPLHGFRKWVAEHGEPLVVNENATQEAEINSLNSDLGKCYDNNKDVNWTC